MAWYHAKKASGITLDSAAAEKEIFEANLEAAKSYLNAAECYPEDDEKHICTFCTPSIYRACDSRLTMLLPGYLISSVQNYWRCAAPLNVTMPLLEKIRLRIPAMKRIWAAKIDRDKQDTYDWMMEAEQMFQKGLDEGSVQLDQQASPERFAPAEWKGDE